MSLTNFKIEPVMCGGNLEHSGSEILFHRLVGDNGQGSRVDWTDHFFTLECFPPWIIRVDRECHIPGNGFRSGGGYFKKVFRFSLNCVANLVEYTFAWLHDHLFI